MSELIEQVNAYRALRRAGEHEAAEEFLAEHAHDERLVSFCRFADDLIRVLTRLLDDPSPAGDSAENAYSRMD